MPLSKDDKRFIEAWIKKLADKVRPHCDQPFKGKQVGRCVYCEHCGYRLYQGRVKK